MQHRTIEITARFSDCGKFCDEICEQNENNLCSLQQNDGALFTELDYNINYNEYERCQACKDLFGGAK